MARNEKCEDVITDITNGASFSYLEQTEGLTPDDFTLTINTDGSPVFKSSRTSCGHFSSLFMNRCRHDGGKNQMNYVVFVGLVRWQCTNTQEICIDDGFQNLKTCCTPNNISLASPEKMSVCTLIILQALKLRRWVAQDTIVEVLEASLKNSAHGY